MGLIFAPIGAILYYFASQVSEITIDYTECKNAGTDMVEIPSDKYNYQTVVSIMALPDEQVLILYVGQ